MITVPRILVAAESADEAEMVANFLRDDYGNLAFSTDPERVVEDFESHCPDVLILAFKILDKAEHYRLQLYGKGALAYQSPHRTLILCGKDELKRAYELCKKEVFDDYIPFWPAPEDPFRLRMAVHHALCQMSSQPTANDFANEAKRIAGLDVSLEHFLSQSGDRVRGASQALAQAGNAIGTTLEEFSGKFEAGEYSGLVEIRNRAGFQKAFSHLKAGAIDMHLQSAVASLHPLRQWSGALRDRLSPQMGSVRALQMLAKRVRPCVLVVDDDEYQIKLLAQLLVEERVELTFAASGGEALAILRKCRPDLVLMDVNLPDLDGVETTRRLKAVEHFVSVPVIMMTGRSEKQVVEDSFKAGASDFVVKPFDKPTLLGKVRKYL